MGTNGVRAGKAYVEITTDETALEAGLRRAATRLKTFGATVNQTMGRFGAATRGNTGLPEPLQQIADFAFSPAGITTGLSMLIVKAAAVADELDRMSTRTGIAVDTLSRLKYAANMSDLPFMTIVGAVAKMQRAIAQGAKGTEGLLGLTTEEQLFAMADQIGAIEDPTLRTAKAMELFGKSGAELIPFFDQGAEGIKAMMEESDRLGFTADPKEIAKLADTDNAIKGIHLAIGNLVQVIGGELAPIFTKMANGLGGLVRMVRDFVKTHEGAVATIYRVVTAITGLGAAASVLAVVMPSIAPLLGGAMAAVAAILAGIMSPVGLVVAGIVAMAAAAGWASGAIQAAFSAIGSKIATVVGEITTIFNGAFDALVGGDFQLAWDIVCKGMELIWAQTVDNMKQAWNLLVDGLGAVLGGAWKIWPKLIREAKALWTDFAGWFEKTWNSVLVKLTSAMAGAVAGVVEGIGKALDGLWGMGGAAADFRDAAGNIRSGLTYEPKRTDAQVDADTSAKKKALTADQATAGKVIDAKVAVALAALRAATDPAEIARLQAELAELIRKASALPEPGKRGGGFNPIDLGAAPGASVAGTFNARAVGGLGTGGVFREMKKELVEIKAHMGRLVEVNEGTLDEMKNGMVYA